MQRYKTGPGDLRHHRAHYDIIVMRLAGVVQVGFDDTYLPDMNMI